MNTPKFPECIQGATTGKKMGAQCRETGLWKLLKNLQVVAKCFLSFHVLGLHPRFLEALQIAVSN